MFSTDNIKKFLKEDCVKISFPYVYNSSFYTTYWEGASPRWTLGTLVNCGWRDIMKLIMNNTSLEEILSLYDKGKIDFYFEERLNICMKYLKEKEKDCDIKVSNFIYDNYKTKRLFVTQNHITKYFITWISNRILEIININLISESLEIDSTIEAYCLYDNYNKNHYEFNYNTDHMFNNESTKYKIIEFYNFFINKKNSYSPEDIIPYIINTDPEKFINSPY